MFEFAPRAPTSTFISYVKSPVPTVGPDCGAETVISEFAFTDLA